MKRFYTDYLLHHHFNENKMAFVVGPRQVGKTTLAFQVLDKRKSRPLYRTWDNLEWRREFALAPYGFLEGFISKTPGRKPLAVLDEIQKYPRWKNYLKGLFDSYQETADFLVTGSARLDIYQKGGDSLLGRYHQYRLHPFSVREVLGRQPAALEYACDDLVKDLEACGRSSPVQQEAFDGLLRFGGFPEPFLRQSPRSLKQWHREHKDLIVREEMRNLSQIQLLAQVEHLVELLGLRPGSLLSINSLTRDVQASYRIVKLWLDYLMRLYYIFTLKPYAGKIQRALVKEPKLYFWDWSEIEDPGKRLENMVASHLLKWCHFNQDWGLADLNLHYIRDKEKREVDFLITKDRRPWMLVETKAARQSPGAGFFHFKEKLAVPHCFLVTGEHLKTNGTVQGITVMDGSSFLSLLPV